MPLIFGLIAFILIAVLLNDRFIARVDADALAEREVRPVFLMVSFHDASARLQQTLTDRAVAEALDREFGE